MRETGLPSWKPSALLIRPNRSEAVTAGMTVTLSLRGPSLLTTTEPCLPQESCGMGLCNRS